MSRMFVYMHWTENLGPDPTQIQIWGMQKIDVGHVSTAYLLFAKYSFDLLSRGRSSAGDYLFDELTDMDKHKIEWP